MCTSNVNAQYASNVGYVAISTPNPSLDGTGAMGTVLTAASNGTFVKAIQIKATSSTMQGVVRIFIDDGSSTLLFREVRIPAVLQTGIVQAYKYSINIPFSLESGYTIKASTQNGDLFDIIAIGNDWTNCSCPTNPS